MLRGSSCGWRIVSPNSNSLKLLHQTRSYFTEESDCWRSSVIISASCMTRSPRERGSENALGCTASDDLTMPTSDRLRCTSLHATVAKPSEVHASWRTNSQAINFRPSSRQGYQGNATYICTSFSHAPWKDGVLRGCTLQSICHAEKREDAVSRSLEDHNLTG